MPSSHLILCRPLLLLSPIPPSIRVFPNESTLHMRWPKYWTLSGKESAQACIPRRLLGRPDEALGGGNQGPSAPGWDHVCSYYVPGVLARGLPKE